MVFLPTEHLLTELGKHVRKFHYFHLKKYVNYIIKNCLIYLESSVELIQYWKNEAPEVVIEKRLGVCQEVPSVFFLVSHHHHG